MREQTKQLQLLEAIVETIQPTIKRDCNYFNIDKIKKQAKYDEENQKWILPKLVLMSQQTPGVPGSEKMSARQHQLLNSRSNGGLRGEMGRKQMPRRLQPLDDF